MDPVYRIRLRDLTVVVDSRQVSEGVRRRVIDRMEPGAFEEVTREPDLRHIVLQEAEESP